MIQYIPHNDIDFSKWDACLDKASNGTIYAYSWYLNNSCEQWDALIEGDYEIIMPLPIRKKMGIAYVFPPSMTQQLGIFSTKQLSEKKVTDFINHIPSKFKYIEINLNHSNRIWSNVFPISDHINLELDLNQTYDTLYANYSENTRRSIKKARKTDIRLWNNGEIKNLTQLFIREKAGKIGKLPDDYYRVLEKISNILIQRNQAQIWEAFIDGDLCAGILFAFCRNKVYFLFSAANATARENFVIPYLIDLYIQEHAEKAMILDFEGSDNKNLARFYKSFGATEKNYQKIIINKLPRLLFSLGRSLKKN